jgi:DNA-directed RNA polymerase beta' subunit
MKIYLDEEHRVSREKAAEVAREIVFTTVGDVASMYIDTLRASIVIQLDAARMMNRGITKDGLKDVLNITNCKITFENNLIIVTPKDAKDLSKRFEKVPSTPIKGISGIKRALVTNEGGEWMINIDGSNEIADTLGIEAARNALIEEAKSVLDEQGLDVDTRHVMLVADIMTASGEVYQVGRHGVSGKKVSVLARAAFEITIPTIVDAAVKGTVDVFKGATESVIVGQNIPIGTGLIEIYMGLNRGSPEENTLRNIEDIERRDN